MMNLPSIQSDKNFTTIFMDNMTLWFSYTTLVAFRVGANDKVVHENVWSNTTGKHLNQIDEGDKASRVSRGAFLTKWQVQTDNKPTPQGVLG